MRKSILWIYFVCLSLVFKSVFAQSGDVIDTLDTLTAKKFGVMAPYILDKYRELHISCSWGEKLYAAYKNIQHKLTQSDSLSSSVLQEHGLERKYLDAMALQYTRLKESTRMVVLFPVDRHKKDMILDILRNSGEIVYEKEVALTREGPLSAVKHLYCSRPELIGNWENDFLGARDIVQTRFVPDSNSSRIITCFLWDKYSENNKENKQEAQDILQDIYVSSDRKETLISARMLFNQNSIDFINKARPKNYATFRRLFAMYTQWISDYDINEEYLCLDTSSILSAYGMRDCGDFDCLHYGCYSKDILKTRPWQIDCHNHMQSLYSKKFDDMIFNPQYHFYYQGQKFLTLQIVRELKRRRGMRKDWSDVRLIDRFLRDNRVYKNVIAPCFKQKGLVQENMLTYFLRDRAQEYLLEHLSKNNQEVSQNTHSVTPDELIIELENKIPEFLYDYSKLWNVRSSLVAQRDVLTESVIESVYPGQQYNQVIGKGGHGEIWGSLTHNLVIKVNNNIKGFMTGASLCKKEFDDQNVLYQTLLKYDPDKTFSKRACFLKPEKFDVITKNHRKFCLFAMERLYPLDTHIIESRLWHRSHMENIGSYPKAGYDIAPFKRYGYQEIEQLVSRYPRINHERTNMEQLCYDLGRLLAIMSLKVKFDGEDTEVWIGRGVDKAFPYRIVLLDFSRVVHISWYFSRGNKNLFVRDVLRTIRRYQHYPHPTSHGYKFFRQGYVDFAYVLDKERGGAFYVAFANKLFDAYEHNPKHRR